jgi:predicted nucleic acid-binding Zn ribbon protein
MERPKPVRSILEDALKGLEIDVHLKTYSIWGAWKEIVGESVALHAQPHAIRNQILFVHVSHPTWVQQLQFLKSALIDKINTFLGETLIRDIRFHLGKIESEVSPRQKNETWQSQKLEEETSKRIETLLQGILHEDVRKSLRTLLVKGAKLEQYRKHLG